jgi:hypothetical protein
MIHKGSLRSVQTEILVAQEVLNDVRTHFFRDVAIFLADKNQASRFVERDFW